MKKDRFRLDGKVAIITGGSRGIGNAIARGFAESGADVVITGRKAPALEESAKNLSDETGRRVVPVMAHGDNMDELDHVVRRTLEELGGIDILVNNAATNPKYGPALEMDEKAWDKVMNVNVKGYFFLTQKVAKEMINKGKGKIINISSIAGISSEPGLSLYSISKAAVIMMTRSFARELGSHHINVNAIAPGTIRTKFSELLWTTESILKPTLEKTPLGRIGETSDIVGSAIFLASEESDYMTGNVLILDGGGAL